MTSLSFYFNTREAAQNTKRIVVDDSPDNYKAQLFITSPLYNIETNEVIGSKTTVDDIQQTGPSQYLLHIQTTYMLNDMGSVSWQFSTYNNTPSQFFTTAVPSVSNIVSTTGDFLGRTGTVSVAPSPTDLRVVTVLFNIV
jgi:hypothetical protein